MSARILGYAEALEVVLAHAAGVSVPAAETVELLAALGRVSAENVTADRDQPPFHRAARDGFAVRSAEIVGGERLRIAGQVRAGDVWTGGAMAPGSAIEIMTGAPVPAGADAVVMVEHVVQSGGEVWLSPGRNLTAGENIVAKGSEALAGDILLARGKTIDAAGIAVAAACGRSELQVRTRPKVAIIATGDELVELDETPRDHEIRNSNSYALAALVLAAGGTPGRLPIARDNKEDVRARIAQGRMWDLLLISGGVSAGKYDLVEEVLAQLGAEFFFTGVKMQPGKPVVFGRLPARQPPVNASPEPECYFFGLPGNPISTEVTFHCFVAPMLRAMSGAGVGGPRFVQATLGGDVTAKVGLIRLLPALLSYDLAKPTVRVVGWQGSGDLAANARANCYAVLPDGQEMKAGDVITVLLR